MVAPVLHVRFAVLAPFDRPQRFNLGFCQIADEALRVITRIDRHVMQMSQSIVEEVGRRSGWRYKRLKERRLGDQASDNALLVVAATHNLAVVFAWLAPLDPKVAQRREPRGRCRQRL